MLHRPAKSWLKITVDTPTEYSEEISAFLANLTGCGTEHAAGYKSLTPTDREQVIGYLIDTQQSTTLEKEILVFLNTLQQQFPDTKPATLHTEIIEEIDWNENWKKHFKPFNITPRLVIKPTWEPYKPIKKEAVIEIDPGMAFGTGHHASTKLALELLEFLFFSKKSTPKMVLDVGTGTGILGMACALFGSVKIIAIDNDPDAVAAAKKNVSLNDLDAKIEVSDQNITTLDGSFNLVIANITHDVLTELSPILTRLITTSGPLILAGILKGDQQESIKRTYSNLNLKLCKEKSHDEWAGLCFIKGNS